MEYLIEDKDFKEILSYYIGQYEYLTVKRHIDPAAACVVLFCATVDVALRTVYSDDNENAPDE